MEIPIITLKNTLDSLLGWVRANTLNNVDADTWLHHTFDGVVTGNFDFFSEAKELVTRDVTNPRKLETRFMYDKSRAELPTVHIHMPSENVGDFNSIASGVLGEELMPNDEDYGFILGRAYTTTYDLIITGSSSTEILLIYELLKALFMAGASTLQHNFEVFDYSGNELMANPELIPNNIFYRAFRVTLKYEQKVRTIDSYPTVVDILLPKKYVSPEEAVAGDFFLFNGVEYGVVEGANGRLWLDRNLGATRVATSSTDSEAYGDLYQWGRLTDGHEKRTSGTTSVLSTSDVPGHGDFIIPSATPRDWRSPQNDNFWQGVNGINNPCPPGWRLPTTAEWEAEHLSWSTNDSAGAYNSPLKFPVCGLRYADGSLNNVGSDGFYWSSTVDGIGARNLGFNSGYAGTYNGNNRASGRSIRPIKDIA